MSNGKQFDPVAAGATSAINAINRGMTRFQNDSGVPKLPNQQNTVSSARNVISSLSQLSPANVLAKGNAPVPVPGQGNGNGNGEGESMLPNLQNIFGGEGLDIPTPQSFFQSQGSSNGATIMPIGNSSGNGGSSSKSGSSNGSNGSNGSDKSKRRDNNGSNRKRR